MATGAQPSARDRGLRISRRQVQILELAARDFSDKQIAVELGLSLSTVRTQWQRFYRSNGVHSRTGAVGLWLRRQMEADELGDRRLQ